jgi:hypothetical protein
LIGHVEMGAYLVGFRAMATLRPIGELVRTAARLAGRFQQGAGEDPSEYVGLAKAAARRASRLVPGATCLHRALASRVWLARRGVASEIVVGFRREGALEGHAWLEVFGSGEPISMFEQSGYRESFREHAVADRGGDRSFFP